MFERIWLKFKIFVGGPQARRMQRGQAVSEYWPVIGGATGLLFAALGVMLSPWLGETYQTIVDAVFGAQTPEAAMVCVPEEEATYPVTATSDIHRFELMTWVYNESSDTTTVGYSVTSQATGPGPAISHWVLELPGCLTASSVVSASEAYEFVDPDPKTGARGVKFDRGYSDYETRLVFVTLKGNLEKVAGSVVTKAAKRVNSGTIQTPGCENPDECEE
ncbi:MAG: hypothetical protein JXB47_12685 [Anaerolineae bacterium]|nr:hypothetical protein [Anaerolineae bacterium]